MCNRLYESQVFLEWQLLPAQIASGFAKLYVNGASMTLTESARLHRLLATREPVLPTPAMRGREPHPSASKTRITAPFHRIFPIFPHPAQMEKLPVGLIGDEI